MIRTASVALLVLQSVVSGFGRNTEQVVRGSSARTSQETPNIEALLRDATVRQSLDTAKNTEAQTLADQVRFCETAAPPFREAARGELLRRAFTQLGLQNVRIDAVGNVLGDRPGLTPRPRLVVAAHLDTVFPPETEVTVKRGGTKFNGPGIGDNCRGLAVLVAVIRALRASAVKTPASITFVANVGEEGLGNLRGVKELFGVTKNSAAARTTGPTGAIDRFVSIDGPGVFVTHVAVGSHRYLVTFKGPGGHSYGAFGTASPIGALGRAVAKIAQLQVPDPPRTTFNVGRIGGGTAVNAIPADAWMEVDLRSSDPAVLASLDARFQGAIDAAVVEENARWGKAGEVTVTRSLVGDRPASSVPPASPIVQTAVAAARSLGFSAQLSEASTDANLPMSLGIPAITIGGGGSGADAHALTESFDSTDSWKGTQHALLVIIALAQK